MAASILTAKWLIRDERLLPAAAGPSETQVGATLCRMVEKSPLKQLLVFLERRLALESFPSL